MANTSCISFPASLLGRRRRTLAATGLVLLLTTQALLAQTRVDLRSRQTPFQSQGSRNTCICFGAIAGLEAAYKRAGLGTFNLSEEFCNYLGKMSWLHPNWNSASGPAPRMAEMGAGYRENQVAAFGGGGGAAVVRNLATWLSVPLETDLPYRESGYSLGAYSDYRHTYWRSQENVNKQNLDLRNLPRKALTAYRYYGAASYRTISRANNPTDIEAVLRMGYEVVWDFDVKGVETTGTIWRPDSGASRGGHSMLIVGYDRRSSNARNHYFICKNSWGSTGAMSDGFTYVSYDYLRQNGYSAVYITSVRSPRAWPELAFVGRWNLSFDGHRGTLDIYHIPGSMQAVFDENRLSITDRRLGTFKDQSGKMHRVNGEIRGNTLTFWFRGTQPNMCYGDLRETPILCRRFVYHMVNPYRGEMAGWHQDNSGNTPDPAWGGYARIPTTITGTDGFLSPSFNTSQPWAPEMYLGMWNVMFDLANGQLSLQKRNDSLLPASLRETCAALEGEFIESGTNKRRKLTAFVSRSRPADIKMTFTHSTRGTVHLHGYMLSWQKGVFAGDAYSRKSYDNAFYAYRTGSAVIPGLARVIGSGCLGTNGALAQKLSGAPFLGKTSAFQVTGGPSHGGGVWLIGSSRSPLLFSGTKDCFLRVSPLVTLPIAFNKVGGFSYSIEVPDDRKLIGTTLYSQFGGFDPKANPAGLTTSNALYLRVGGYR